MAEMAIARMASASKPVVARVRVAARVIPPTPKKLQVVRVASPLERAEAPADTSASTSSQGAPTQRPDIGAEFFSEADSRPVILFDGVCNMCNGGVNFVLDWDKAAVYRFAALQSPAGKLLLTRSGRRPDDISSIVMVTPGASYTKSQAVLKIAERLEMPLPLLTMFSNAFPDAFRDVIYDWVAENRYKLLGERDACRLMQPEWRERFLV